MSKGKPTMIVVGGGLAGLWATIRMAEAGFPVKIFSVVPVKRSHSVCAQGGINAVLDIKGQGDTVRQHIIDTIKGGDYIADQPPVKSMCEEAPGLVRTYDRMGVPFNRTPEGFIDQRLFGGVKNQRTAFAGSSTGQQLLYACDEQVRKYEEQGLVEKYETWEFLSAVLDDEGRCRGISAINLITMQVEVFPADAVLLATGGFGAVFGRSTNSVHNTGAAVSRVYQQGALFMNGEFIQIHPTGMQGRDKHRLMSEACRGEGGRLWVPRDPTDRRDPKAIPEKDRFFFLEEWYPAYGNTVPRDVASRAVWKVVKEMGLGINGEDLVYLDLTHKPVEYLAERLGSILEIYETYTGVDPKREPMKIFPCVHYCMSGLWVDFERDNNDGGLKHGHPRNQSTNIPGLYAAGECDGAYHGANRLGANSLLSSSFAGRVAGDSMLNYAKSLKQSCDAMPQSIYEREKNRQLEINKKLLSQDGGHNSFKLHEELGTLIFNNLNVVRDNKTLDKTFETLQDLEDRSHKLTLDDKGSYTNQALIHARQLQDMVVLGQVLTKSARARDECRGAHYKPEFERSIPAGKYKGDPEYDDYVKWWKQNNEKWLKSTIATHTSKGPEISFKDVDTSVFAPEQPRDYR